MEVVVFTNGCFDIIHPGHVDLLKRARQLGTKLIVGINSDQSVRRIKGDSRPFVEQADRAEILKNFPFVDEVVVFDEQTPERLIMEIKPDVLVKGGDWKPGEIVGADFVESNGGRVVSLPLLGDYSSSKIVNKIRFADRTEAEINRADETETYQTRLIRRSLDEHSDCFRHLISTEIENIEKCADQIYRVFTGGGKILICGNGGSAADAQHLAAEFVGRYETERRGLPAIALTTDTSALTAVSNDYGFENVFSRQIEALAAAGDLLVAISTSGNSANITNAVMTARRKGCLTIGLSGKNGKKLASLCDYGILVPAIRTARIQEMHITIAHIWCEIIDAKIYN